jgi:hypothetical protein
MSTPINDVRIPVNASVLSFLPIVNIQAAPDVLYAHNSPL